MDRGKHKYAVVAIYVDVDFYPPTISAILNLSEKFQKVFVICRNNSVKDFPFPANVSLKKIGPQMPVRQMEAESVFNKIIYFAMFSYNLLRLSNKKGVELLLIYDAIALLGYFIAWPLNKVKKKWYHNHDMPTAMPAAKISLMSLACTREKRALKHMNFFSLPQKERMRFYGNVSVPFFFIPNYPSLKLYHSRPNSHYFENGNIVKIIYQGFIGKGLGIEQIIPLLKQDYNGYKINLVLKGPVSSEYKEYLCSIAESVQVLGRIEWIDIGPYSELPEITSSCHIGNAINMKQDIISQYQATASNKIYEYAASGLVVIINDRPEFKEYLDKFKWIYFTTGTTESLESILREIIPTQLSMGAAARSDFETQLNYEMHFEPALNSILS